MRKVRYTALAVITALLSQNTHAQSNSVNEISAATSTPFQAEPVQVEAPLTEEERIQALISKDRPRLQSFVELEEKIFDAELDQEEADYKSTRINRIAQRIQRRQLVLDKQNERLEVVSEFEVLEEKIVELEDKLQIESDPAKRTTLETSLASKTENLSRKQLRIAKLEEKIAILDNKQLVDQQVIEALAKAHREKLELRLNHALEKEGRVTQKIEVLSSKRSSTSNSTKITRIEKQLANNQLRAEKLAGRINKISDRLDELDQQFQG